MTSKNRRFSFIPSALALGILLSPTSNAQVIADFEDGDISQWLVEADGTPSLATNGLPGNCLRLVDQGLGIFHKVVAPAQFTGDFSNATGLDSLTFDLRVQRSGSLNQTDPLITLAGPGGTAIALPGYVPPNNVWHSVAIAFAPSAWTVVSGTWEGLMQHVDLIRIRTEFTYGAETAWLDNVRLTFSPAILPIQGTVCSNWQIANDLDGWSFQNVGSIAVNTTSGNPPGSVRMTDAGGITYAVAAPRFRGDWSMLNVNDSLAFDLFLQTNNTNWYDKEYLVRLSGPGGTALYHTNDSITALSRNVWRHYAIPLDPSAWQLTSGAWNDLLSNVSEIRLELEFIATQNETCFLDNFCLVTDVATAHSGVHEQTHRLLAFPNPTTGQFTLTLEGITGRAEAMVLDAQGRQVGATIRLDGSERHTMDLSGHTNGLYMVRIITEAGAAITRPIVLQR